MWSSLINPLCFVLLSFFVVCGPMYIHVRFVQTVLNVHDSHWGSHQLSAEDNRYDIIVEKKLIHLVTNFLVWLSNQLTIYFMDQFIFHHSTVGNVTLMRFTGAGDDNICLVSKPYLDDCTHKSSLHPISYYA